MTTQPVPATEETGEPKNASGKPLFPPTMTMVACDQCDQPQPWPLRCGHIHVGSYAVEYVHVSSYAALLSEREMLANALRPFAALDVDAFSHLQGKPDTTEVYSMNETGRCSG